MVRCSQLNKVLSRLPCSWMYGAGLAVLLSGAEVTSQTAELSKAEPPVTGPETTDIGGGDMRCYEEGNRVVVDSYFTDRTRKSTLTFWSTSSDEKTGCMLRHENGPILEMAYGSPLDAPPGTSSGAFPPDFFSAYRICRDPDSGLDRLVFTLGQGASTVDSGILGVAPDTHAIKVLHIQFGEFDMADDKGFCFNYKRQQEAIVGIDQRMAELAISDEEISKTADEPDGQSSSPWPEVWPMRIHSSPGKVRDILKYFSSVQDFVDLDPAVYYAQKDRKQYRVIQVISREIGGDGVVLLFDRQAMVWKTIYNVPTEFRYNYPLYDLVIKNGLLLGKRCTYCSKWPKYDDFILDLETGQTVQPQSKKLEEK